MLLIFLLSCDRTSPCEQYVDAYLGCVAASGADTTGIATEVLCASAENKSDAEDYYTCLADVFAEADCTTADGLDAAGDDAQSGCTAPVP